MVRVIILSFLMVGCSSAPSNPADRAELEAAAARMSHEHFTQAHLSSTDIRQMKDRNGGEPENAVKYGIKELLRKIREQK